MRFVLPLVVAAQDEVDFEVISLLRAFCPLLSKDRIVDQDVPDLIGRLREAVPHLVEMLQQESDTIIRNVLAFLNEQHFVSLDDRFAGYLANPGNGLDEGEAGTEEAAVNAFLNCRASELWGYTNGH